MRIVYLSIIFFLLFTGCTTQTQYVCPNGSTVSNPQQCNPSQTASQSSSQNPQGIQNTVNEPTTAAAFCGNNACDSGESSSNCCKDCGCSTGLYCESNMCQPKCGDGIKAEGENSENCCQDAGCPTGESCSNNKCVVLKPEIQSNFLQVGQFGATVLISRNGRDSLGLLTLSNTGNDAAQNTKVTISSPEGYFDDSTLNFDTVSTNPVNKEIKLNFREKILQLSDKTKIGITFDISFQNSANQPYSLKESSTLDVYGRNSLLGGTYPYSYTAYVNPHQPIIRKFASQSTSGLAAGTDFGNQVEQDLAALWLFQSLKSYGIAYVNDVQTVGDYVQTPIETFERKNGDCEDLAILYASMLDSVGIEPVIVTIPGHVFSGYMNIQGSYVVPIETTAPDFQSAKILGLQEYQDNQKAGKLTAIRPRQYRQDYGEVLFSTEPQIPLPIISKQKGNCNPGFDLSKLWTASVDVTFTNSGNAPGAGCASVSSYQNGAVKDTIIHCVTIQPGETKKETFTPDIDFFGGAYDCIVK